jgi:tRNA threonylcarbamoyladenosine biosynthesis protein TsaB
MIILLDTSTPVCKLTLIDGDWHRDYDWQADRSLAKDLLRYLTDRLSENGKTLNDLTGLGIFKGPGSFTGLRIGITVFNTLADSLQLPIVGSTGENWQDDALSALKNDQNDQIVLPEYGGEANITKPRK